LMVKRVACNHIDCQAVADEDLGRILTGKQKPARKIAPVLMDAENLVATVY